MSRIEVLGVDVGGVIIDRANDGTDTSFLSSRFLEATAMPGAIEVLGQLARQRFGRNIFIVSKCGLTGQRKTLEWFEHHRFYSRTGIRRERVWFCLEQNEKAGICKKLGVTHFIDDLLEILGSLTTVKNLYLFQQRPEDVQKYGQFLGKVHQVNSWGDISKKMLS